MDYNHPKKFYHKNIWIALFQLFILMLFCIFLGDFFFLSLFQPIWLHFFPDNIILQLFKLMIINLSTFAGSTWLYFFVQHIDFRVFFRKKIKKIFFIYTLVIMLLGILCSTFLAAWNIQLPLPKVLVFFDAWFKAQNLEMKNFLFQLIKIQNIFSYLLTWGVLSLVPAFGEELFFRGTLQNMLSKKMSIHLAIFFTAFIFSTLHLQWYSFLPRFFLGAILGYIFFYTQNILFPILAHLLNNSMAIIYIFLYPEKMLTDNTSIPLYPIAVFWLSIILIVYFLYIWHRQHFYKH